MHYSRVANLSPCIMEHLDALGRMNTYVSHCVQMFIFSNQPGNIRSHQFSCKVCCLVAHKISNHFHFSSLPLKNLCWLISLYSIFAFRGFMLRMVCIISDEIQFRYPSSGHVLYNLLDIYSSNFMLQHSVNPCPSLLVWGFSRVSSTNSSLGREAPSLTFLFIMYVVSLSTARTCQ